MTKQNSLEVDNLATARFDCVFPICGGVCCQNGRPPVERGERARIEANLEKFLPHLRPSARASIERKGFLSKRLKAGQPMLTVEGGSCVFFNEGCVLHKVGASEGDRFKYKPWHCVVFPLTRVGNGKWYVRQWKHRGEAWDLFCLNPKESPVLASESLKGEAAFAGELDSGSEAWRKRAGGARARVKAPKRARRRGPTAK